MLERQAARTWPPRHAPESAHRVVVEVARRGKLVVGEPYFTPGRADRARRRRGIGDLRHGDLAVVRPGRGRARVERGARVGARGSRTCSRRCSSSTARGPSSSRTTLPEPSLDGRVDLRELTTFTIDPETAKDFDDALSFRREPDGIRAWVHIADVSYFVPGRAARSTAAPRERAFSTYVPGPRRADAAARARRRRLLAAAAPGPPLRHGRDAAGRRAALLPLGDPLGRAAHLRRGASGARRRARSSSSSSWPASSRPRCAARRFARGALEVDDARDRVPLRGRPRRRRVARAASRTRTCSSRS